MAAEARKSGRVALGGRGDERPRRCGRRCSGSPSRGRPGRSAYVPLAHSAIDLPQAPGRAEALAALAPAPRGPGGAQGLGPRQARPRRARAPRRARGRARLRRAHRRPTCSTPADGPTRSRTSPWSTSASAARPARDGIAAADAAAIQTGQVAGAGGRARPAARPGDERAARASEGLLPIYESLEMPLVEVLADLERAGVKVDTALLARMSRDMEAQLQALTSEIHALAKGEFNINSPVQLREVLFDRLGMQSGKKTAKTKAASTAEDVLEELALRARAAAQDPRVPLGAEAQVAPTSTPCPSSSSRRPGASTPPSTRRWRPRAASPPPTPTCRTSPSARAEGRRVREAFVAEPGHLAALRRLQPDRAAGPRAPLRGPDPRSTPSGAARTCTTAPSREIFGPLSGVPRGRAAAHLQDGQLRAALREDRLQPGQGHRRLAQGGRALHRGLLRPLPEGPGLHRRDDREGAGDRPRAHAARAPAPPARPAREELPRAAWRRSGRR